MNSLDENLRWDLIIEKQAYMDDFKSEKRSIVYAQLQAWKIVYHETFGIRINKAFYKVPIITFLVSSERQF